MNRITLFFFAFILSACAQQQRYGDFVEQQPQALYTALASNAVAHLSGIYLVGESTFNVNENLGPMGTELDAQLRARGYALSHLNGTPFNYVFDRLETSNGPLFRLSLYVGDSLHNRACRVNSDGNAISHSPWTVLYTGDLVQNVELAGGGHE